ncbi:GrpB family protein [Defluviitalea saccharophila]|uniref:GrpB family protein n=1 Tax=Defluviitalea saccharophila TaxID=879970 RepID=A0ABZ2Y5G8_9FIRM
MKVEVVEYNREWPVLFMEEAEEIKRILGEELIDIYHIGSTAVENLRAKPIIDIMPVVRDITKIDAYNKEFEALGYEPKGELGITGRRFFRKGSEVRTHHIHIFEKSNSKEIRRHLAVRDYLRAHPNEVLEYGQLESKLAVLYPADIEAYCDGKDAFVKELERKALNWYEELNQ